MPGSHGSEQKSWSRPGGAAERSTYQAQMLALDHCWGVLGAQFSKDQEGSGGGEQGQFPGAENPSHGLVRLKFVAPAGTELTGRLGAPYVRAPKIGTSELGNCRRAPTSPL